jgi:hypothetical protein
LALASATVHMGLLLNGREDYRPMWSSFPGLSEAAHESAAVM